jgi:hypothetical protein
MDPGAVPGISTKEIKIKGDDTDFDSNQQATKIVLINAINGENSLEMKMAA